MNAINAVSVRARLGLIYVALGVIAVGAAFAGGLLAHAPTITDVKTVQRAPSSGASLAAAWGRPDQVVAGGRISVHLKGLTCAVYQPRKAILCYAP
jgi:hypothetical protein